MGGNDGLGLDEHLFWPCLPTKQQLLDRIMVVLLASIYRVSIGSRHTHAPVKLCEVTCRWAATSDRRSMTAWVVSVYCLVKESISKIHAS